MSPYYLIVVVLVLQVCTAAGISEFETVYPYYKMVEESVTTNPHSLYVLRQKFLPVVTDQHWLLDNVHNIRITGDIDYYNNNSGASFRKGYQFRWTDSSLLSLISPDEFLAFDPLFFLTLYSSMMKSKRSNMLAIPIQLRENSSAAMNASEVERMVKKSLTVFFSWGKAYARSNGVPTHWDDKDQGYVGTWYSYYAIGSPSTFQYKYQKYFQVTHLGFLIMFTFLNLLLPVVLLRNASKWNNTLQSVFRQYAAAAKYFWATGVTLMLFNASYVVGAICIHWHNHPAALSCLKHDCSIPKSEYKNTLTFEALIAKCVLFPFAVALELIAAAIVAKNLEISSPPVFASKMFHCCKLASYLKTFFFWNYFIFIQIMVGLTGIPLTITFAITPALTTTAFMMMLALLMLPAVLIGYAFRIKWSRSMCGLRKVWRCSLSFLTAFLLIGALIMVLALYLTMAQEGLSMNGVKGYVVSLLPTLLLSLLAWALKTKLMRKKAQSKGPKYQECKDDDSDVELLDLHDEV